MRGARALLLLAFSFCACASVRHEPLVSFNDPDVIYDIRYATDNNFTHQAVYSDARCILRADVAKRLAEAARQFVSLGYRLKIFDCYRPLSVQKLFWNLFHDERYVADPKKGSRHNRGAAVDVTLVDSNGVDVEMTSGFDDFSPRAHRDYPNATEAARKNRALLEKVMFAHGFVGLSTEWWHFDSFGWKRYPVEDVPFETIR